MGKPNVLFVLTIDTEEEWQWDDEFPQHDCSVDNVEKLPAFQAFCQSLGIRPTYFVDYAVANNDDGSRILREFVNTKQAEVGAHLHPWCNPPYFGKTTEAESHVINLPEEQVVQKLDELNRVINEKIGVTPRSFRSGRWGMKGKTLELLTSRGITVDSSVYPFYENPFFHCKGAPSTPYYPSFDNALAPGEQQNIMELPVTAGFNVKNFSKADKIHSTLSKPPFSTLRAVGLLWHTKILKKIYLSPELSDTKSMIELSDTCLDKQHDVIHMYLHSSSLIDGVTGLLNVDNAYELICSRIAQFLAHLEAKANVSYCTISEAAARLKAKEGAVTTRLPRGQHCG
ncbi:WalW protein [Alteromonas sp. MB-3u-76]|uniref:polysaccharide deacetylase family protein n=1 Tax=Alteromonas sp. MB-3u-76 TaxID=2058133 RepID=UPI000C314EE4|nr:polysaccharide deacetylase family protein [Alteromonas sp. MB-3u-76]AUC89109.1 WalW protein [Alteromonas sp. MB-3u-76]